MAYQTVSPYDNQIVATFDHFSDEQVMDHNHVPCRAQHVALECPSSYLVGDFVVRVDWYTGGEQFVP